ncbi:MAG: aspartate 1-decarboxylase [Candidatus Zixiibacteriota bacterium]
MMITICRAKIHRATVTDANLDYQGSITIDKNLIDAAGLFVYEKVQVVNINNGERFETYVIEGKPGSGEICLNGAAARLGLPGDKVIIISYAQLHTDEMADFRPNIVKVDANNKIVEA